MRRLLFFGSNRIDLLVQVRLHFFEVLDRLDARDVERVIDDLTLLADLVRDGIGDSL